MLGTSRHVRRFFSIAPLKVESSKYAVRNLSSKRSCSLISVPISLGQPHIGADYSPARLKEAGLLKLIQGLNWKVNEIPDIVAAENINTNSAKTNTLAVTKAKNIAQVGHTSENVYKTVLKEAKKDDFVLILGGDHCIPIGTITGLKQARPSMGVVWVDAHADLNTPESSNSGNMHGMPLGFLMGLVENVQRYPSMDWFKPCLNPSEIVYIGLRDLDEFEKVMIKKLGIKAYTMYDVDRIGIGRVMAEIEEYFKEKQHIHLSYDIDALDPVFAPHTGTAVTGGLTFREGNFICEYLYNTGKMTSMELVEININLAQHVDPKTTIDMSLTILGSTMGKSIL